MKTIEATLGVGEFHIPQSKYERVISALTDVTALGNAMTALQLLLGAESDKPFRLFGDFAERMTREGIALGLFIRVDSSKLLYADEETRAVVFASLKYYPPAYEILPHPYLHALTA